MLRRPLQKTLWQRQGWDPLDLSHLRTNFVLCSAAATGIQACVDYCRCWRGKRLCWLTPAGLAWAAPAGAGTLRPAARAPSTWAGEGTVAKAAVRGSQREEREGCVSLASTPPPSCSARFFFSFLHSWGLPHHPPLGLPIQNKVSLYLMVMADVRGIWQRQKRSLSLSNISPDVV